MCECNNCESEQVEPTEDLNRVNVHDGTWRVVEIGETIIAGDMWTEEDGSQSSVLTSIGERLHIPNALYRRIPDAVPNSVEPAAVPPIVSDDEDTRPDEQRTLDTILEGLRSARYTEDGTRYESAIETMRRQFEHGHGVDEHGGLFTVGFTGKRKSLTIAQFRDWQNWSYSDNSFCTFLQRIGKAYPPKIKTAFGEDVHAVFEKYRPGSCMAGSCCRDMRTIYACNPDSVGTVYSVRDTTNNPLIESSCSALFWLGKKRIYLDRMYSSGVQNIYCQYDWFADYLETTYGKPVVPIYTSSKQRRQWEKTVTFKLVDSGNPLPYIDNLYTVKKYDHKHVWLTTDESASDIHCRDTSGTYPDGRDRCQCCECGCRMDEDYARSDNNGNVYCDSCYSDSFAHCEWSEEDYPADEVNSVECWCYGSRYRERNANRNSSYQLSWHTLSISDDALSSYFTELHDGTYASNGNTIEDNRGNTHATDVDSWDNVTLTEDGDLYLTDDVVQLSDGRTYPADDCVEVDGGWYLLGEEPEQDDDGTEVSENENTLVETEVTE